MKNVLGLALCLVLTLGCGATWKRCAYAPADRDEWQQPAEVVRLLALTPGQRVADLGAGGGYFTFRLALAVGSGGRVYAVDVDPDMTEYLTERVAEEGHTNIEVVHAGHDDPGLPDASIDLLFTSNTYHHIEDRPAYFRRLRDDLAPGGRVAVLEYGDRGGWFATTFGHSTPKQQIVAEMQEAGYRLLADHAFLERQNFLVFGP